MSVLPLDFTKDSQIETAAMAYKLKSNRSAAKRFRVTATGKVKRKRNNLRHILTAHPRKVKRRYRMKTYVRETEIGHVRQLLPYSF
jgi:large subunit ribosomal protein L35